MERTGQLKSYFPVQPYPIQLDIARTLFEAIDKFKLALIESPTGTGKTYSLLAPLVAWLTSHPTDLGSESKPQERKGVPSWLRGPGEEKGKQLLKKKKQTVSQMVSITAASNQARQKKTRGEKPTKDQELDVESEDENDINQPAKRRHDIQVMQAERQLSLKDAKILPKIIFVSRTHSQLSQVVLSLRSMKHNLSYIELASKDHLCINEELKAGSKHNISEKCQYLLDHGGCKYHHKYSIEDFFGKTVDEGSKMGKESCLCPYYATRNLLPHCDILCLPYSSILSPQIRLRMGLNLHNSLIVFDQGHNILDYERDLESAGVTVNDLEGVSQRLDDYLQRYKDRMKVKNYNLLCHFLEVVRALRRVASQYERQRKDIKETYMKLKFFNFIADLGVKQIQVEKIKKYIQLNNIDKKLVYFNEEKSVKKQQPHLKQGPSLSSGTINTVIDFICLLCQFDDVRHILMIKWGQKGRHQFKIMCRQGSQLTDIIKQSRMTIIAGGTMQPLNVFSPLMQQFPDTLIKKYPHVIQPNQCKISILKQYKKQQILFNHQASSQPNSAQQYGEVIKAVMDRVIKRTEEGGGIVVFIQNYRLVELFREVLSKEEYHKQVFYDGKEGGDVFKAYTEAVNRDCGAHQILVSVMGGKLSEGINFSDKLARALVVFGLPYPNLYAAQVSEMMAYHDSREGLSGRKYYENLCLRTLNQTIGRGVRHIHDYVEIYLVDRRFEGIVSGLSEWMRPRIEVVEQVQNL